MSTDSRKERKVMQMADAHAKLNMTVRNPDLNKSMKAEKVKSSSRSRKGVSSQGSKKEEMSNKNAEGTKESLELEATVSIPATDKDQPVTIQVEGTVSPKTEQQSEKTIEAPKKSDSPPRKRQKSSKASKRGKSPVSSSRNSSNLQEALQLYRVSNADKSNGFPKAILASQISLVQSGVHSPTPGIKQSKQGGSPKLKGDMASTLSEMNVRNITATNPMNSTNQESPTTNKSIKNQTQSRFDMATQSIIKVPYQPKELKRPFSLPRGIKQNKALMNKDSSMIHQKLKSKRQSHAMNLNDQSTFAGNNSPSHLISQKDYWKVYKMPVVSPLTSTNIYSSKTDFQLEQKPKKYKRKNLAKILKEKSDMLASQAFGDNDKESQDPDCEPEQAEDPGLLPMQQKQQQLGATVSSGFGVISHEDGQTFQPQQQFSNHTPLAAHKQGGGLFSTSNSFFQQHEPQSQLTKNTVRANRMRIETDVQKLHNRIQMLQAEEEKALKHIEQTRTRVREILKAKNDAIEESKQKKKGHSTSKKLLNTSTTRNEFSTQRASGLDKRFMRNQSSNMFNTSVSNAKLPSISRLPAKSSRVNLDDSQMSVPFPSSGVQKMLLHKQEEASAYKLIKGKMLKQREKMEKKELKTRQNQIANIKIMCEQMPKARREQQEIKRWESVRKNKEAELITEIKKMNQKEKDAKKLEHLEAKILKRLKETHLKQQLAIEEIQNIFSMTNDGSTGGAVQNNTTSINVANAEEATSSEEEQIEYTEKQGNLSSVVIDAEASVTQ